MAHDDRDRNFEKALARHLRFSAPSSVEADAIAGASLHSCPDPEILAAYHEQSLSPDELGFWKQHVVACKYCQFVLAQLAATENLALNPAPTKEPFLVGAPATSKERSRDTGFVKGERRPPSWRWVLLIPAGAIAASLVAWVSLRNGAPAPASPAPAVQTAENQPAPPLPSQPKPAIVVPSDQKEKVQSASPSAGAIGGLVSSNRDTTANAPHNDLQRSQQSQNQLTAIPSHGPSVNLQKQQQQQLASRVSAGSAGAAPRKKLEQSTPVESSENAKSVAVPAPPPPPPPSEPSFLDGREVAAPSPSKVSPAPPAPTSNASTPQELPKDKAAAADAISSTSETVEVSAEPQSTSQAKAMIRAAALQNPHVFVAPDGKHLWRVGPAGSLERSKDEGLKWTAQVSGVNADLTAGSAPSARVAWIVGTSGTILRTTDAGAHWTKINSPVANDLTGVRAIDAFHATIWFVADPQSGATKTYETTDGGATWSPIPPK
jgi:hypothetical protein